MESCKLWSSFYRKMWDARWIQIHAHSPPIYNLWNIKKLSNAKMICKSYIYFECGISVEKNSSYEQSKDETEILSAVSSKMMEMWIPKVCKLTPQCNVVRVLVVETQDLAFTYWVVFFPWFYFYYFLFFLLTTNLSPHAPYTEST